MQYKRWYININFRIWAGGNLINLQVKRMKLLEIGCNQYERVRAIWNGAQQTVAPLLLLGQKMSPGTPLRTPLDKREALISCFLCFRNFWNHFLLTTVFMYILSDYTGCSKSIVFFPYCFHEITHLSYHPLVPLVPQSRYFFFSWGT